MIYRSIRRIYLTRGNSIKEFKDNSLEILDCISRAYKIICWNGVGGPRYYYGSNRKNSGSLVAMVAINLFEQHFLTMRFHDLQRKSSLRAGYEKILVDVGGSDTSFMIQKSCL